MRTAAQIRSAELLPHTYLFPQGERTGEYSWGLKSCVGSDFLSAR